MFILHPNFPILGHCGVSTISRRRVLGSVGCVAGGILALCPRPPVPVIVPTPVLGGVSRQQRVASVIHRSVSARLLGHAYTPDTGADKFQSLERINSVRETNRSLDSCNSCKRLGTSPVSKFPFVSRIEFIRSKLSIFLFLCRDCQSRAGLEKGLNFTVISNPQCVI